MIDVPIQVKDALREGRLRKNYRFQVLNDDGTVDFTIDNDNLVSESVNIDERMCSGDKIKYGLCEGSSLEFQYFGKENITGRQLKVFVDVDYIDLVTQYSWETQASIDTAYTVTGMSGECRLYTDLDDAWDFVYVTENGSTTQVYPTYSESGTIIELGDVSGRTLLVALPEIPAPRAELQLYVPHDEPTVVSHAIPMGYFTVKNCSRQASTGIIKAVCYNKLQSDYLDAKANDLLISQFPSVAYLMDIIRVLLGDYGIDQAEIENVPPDKSFYDYAWSDAKRTFSPFRYSSFNGDQGPFSPTIIQTFYTITTSTNMYLSGNAKINYYKNYDSSPIAPFRPIRIKVNDAIPIVDANIAQFIKNQLNKISANTSGDVLWTRLQSMKGYQGSIPFKYLEGYFFGIVITFSDDSYKIFGNNVLNADGTFKDVEKYTFTNVKSITTIVPDYIQFGHQLYADDGGISYTVQTLSGANNHVFCHGGDRPYETALGTKTYSPPRMPNGDVIDPLNLLDMIKVEAITGGISEVDMIELSPTSIGDVTLRELQSADFETKCQFGQLSRETDLFSGVELNRSRLLPADTLYPDNALYPGGAQESAFRSQYSKLWADEGNVRKWRYLIITYKGLDENQQEKDFTLQRTINNDGTDNYNCSDNWLFRNLIWTATDIGTYADAMVLKMRDITWFPFEMWCAGLPYLETGDEIEIPLGEETYTSYILQRQLKGIQNLQDTYINGTLDIF